MSVTNKKRTYITSRYRADADFELKLKQYIIRIYATDANFNLKQKQYITSKYATDVYFNLKRKQYTTSKYATDANFNLKKKQYITRKYATDAGFKSKQKQYTTGKYHNERHLQHCMSYMKTKRHTQADFRITHKMQCTFKIIMKYRRWTCVMRECSQPVDNRLMQTAISTFHECIKAEPTFVCMMCHRTLFPNQVKHCIHSNYKKNLHIVVACLTGKYVHVGNNHCQGPEQCTVPDERPKEWICNNCVSHLKAGHKSSITVANNMELAPIPPELCDLYVLERQLLAKILPFAKIITLPKGRQAAIHGTVVCVPSEVKTTANTLPRSQSTSQLHRVKLKRRLTYKGHQLFHNVNMRNVVAGLSKLDDNDDGMELDSCDETKMMEIHERIQKKL
ncbi:Hypothetical predicted protein [Pelobates cultripes]|uniref:DUF6570 domain-containing protein n=1 Tax=Pelobates cultripes TaxID=61616 RepID=A0AAD1WLU8_PELCU|nr:Hypothetical predicted protein [Pelobates cultripes]